MINNIKILCFGGFSVTLHYNKSEPLLNPEIEKYIIQTRQCFPKSEIQIITNGLLLLQLSDRMMNIFFRK